MAGDEWMGWARYIRAEARVAGVDDRGGQRVAWQAGLVVLFYGWVSRGRQAWFATVSPGAEECGLAGKARCFTASQAPAGPGMVR
jgi:hypothetical protein